MIEGGICSIGLWSRSLTDGLRPWNEVRRKSCLMRVDEEVSADLIEQIKKLLEVLPLAYVCHAGKVR